MRLRMDEQKGIGIPVWCTYTGVFLLFFLCGIGSGAVSFDRFPEGRGIILPLPFAFLSQVLYLRYSVRGVFAMPLMMVVWQVSYFVAFGVGMGFPLRFFVFLDQRGLSFHLATSTLSCLVGGLIGGIGLSLCCALCYRRLFSMKHISIGAFLGAVSALSFLPRVLAYTANVNGGLVRTPVLSFGLWEAIMGTYLYVICLHSHEQSIADELEELGSDPLRLTPR